MNNIQQNLLQAIDLIAINQASAVNFDTTEIATVLSKLDNGNYWVSNGKVKYEAKSTETISYTENTQVYVSVSQGDYSQDKVIIGRYDNRNEEEKAYLYKDPYQRLGVSHIIVMETNEQKIDFNSTALGQPTLLGIETSVNVNTKPKDGVGYYSLQINLLNNNNETLMSFIVDSRNFIGNPYNMVSGIKHKNIFTLPNDFNISDVEKIKATSYGDDVEWSSITLRFGYDLESETIVNSESKAFIGTDNGLNTYGEGDNDSYREVLIKKFNEFKENTAAHIDHIEAFDNDLNTKNAFKCGNGQNDARCSISLDEGIQGFNLETNIKYQIKFKYFVKTNSIYIGTNNNKIYGIAGMYQRDTNLFFGNTINLDKDPGQWHEAILDFVINSNNQYYSFAIKLNFGGPENYLGDINPYIYIKDFEIYKLQPIPLNNLCFSWVKDGQVYSPNNPAEDLETSVSWYKYAPNKIDENLGVGWEKINSEDAWTLGVRDNYLDSTIPEERFRARLVYNDVDYLSNVLVLKNKDYVGESAAAVSPTMTLRLNDDGIYLYDHTAQLYETEKTLKTVSASSNAGFEDDYRDLYWLIPKNNTMIAAPRLIEKKNSSATEYWYWDYLPDIHFSDNDKPTDFTSSVSYLKDYDLDTNNYYVIGGNGIKLEQNIYIKRSYQPNYLNNTIQCKAFFGDTSTPNEEGSVDLKFVSANSSGVEASLGIELVSEKGYLGGGSDTDIKLKGVVYDKNGIPFENQPEIKMDKVTNILYDGRFYYNDNRGAGTNINYITVENNIITITNDTESDVTFQLVFLPNGYNAKSGEQQEVVNCYDHNSDNNLGKPNDFSIEIERLDDFGVIDIMYDLYRDDNGTGSGINPLRTGAKLIRLCGNNNTKMTKDSKSTDINKRYVINSTRVKKLRINFQYLTNEDDRSEKLQSAYNSGERLKDEYDELYNNVILQSIQEDFLTDEITLLVYSGNKNTEKPGSLPYINFYLPGNKQGEEKECQFKCSLISSNINNITISSNSNIVQSIKASCTWNSEVTNKPVQLTSYYQIPYFPTSNVYQLEGPTKFTYSSFGDMPYPASINKYKLFDSSGKEVSDFSMSINTDIIKINDSKHTIALPELAPAEKSYYILDIKIGDTLIAQFPISLLRNGYAFKELNAWGGSTVTTEDYVLSPMIGAGSKNSQNQFTGVIMGTSSEFPSTGLYGFKDGVATFGFKEDGSCFLGANEETGRIEFNTGGNGGELIINAQINRIGRKFQIEQTTNEGQGTISLFENNIILTNGGYTTRNSYQGLFSGLELINKVKDIQFSEDTSSFFKTLIGNFNGISLNDITAGNISDSGTCYIQHSINRTKQNSGGAWIFPRMIISCINENTINAGAFPTMVLEVKDQDIKKHTYIELDASGKITFSIEGKSATLQKNNDGKLQFYGISE